MNLARYLLFSVALAGLASGPAKAQSAAELLEQAVRAYQDLEFDAAAALLRRALVPDPDVESDPRVEADALAYLAASEFFRGRPVSASTSFRRLIRFDPRYRPDQLVFPPEVTNLFEELRRQTKAIKVAVPDESTIRLLTDRFTTRLLSSSLHDIRADIRRPDGTEVKLLYNGPIADSLDVGWDVTDQDESPAFGSVLFHVASMDDDGRVLGVVQVPLRIERVPPDTVTHPQPLADDVFLPENRASGPGIEALAGGILAGAAVVVLPSVIAGGSEPSEARFAVGGVVSLAGIVGFFSRRPGEPFPDNVQANQARRDEWQRRRAEIEAENQRRIADLLVRISAGSPLVDERN